MGVLMAENADKSVLIDDLQDAQGIAEMSAAKNLLPGDVGAQGAPGRLGPG